jgi:rhodanese-related sulfurtransferase
LFKTAFSKLTPLAFLLPLCLACPKPVVADDEPVNITHDLPYVDIVHNGKTVRIQRNPDTLNLIDSEYALTSRPCPPFCIQPMILAEGVDTIGELELIDYLRAISAGDQSVIVVDSRTEDWTRRTGIIPGAVVIPWDKLYLAKNDPEKVAKILEDKFSAHRDGPFWEFSRAKTVILYCNGAWCGQSPTNIKTLLSIGYPPNKLKWYRGGMQDWTSLGLTTVAP